MFEKHSIKKQFMYSLISVIVLSLISSFLLSASVLVVSLGKSYFNVNDEEEYEYYDQEVKQIERYIDEKNEELLKNDVKPKLERIINTNKMKYEVVDIENNIIYGNLNEEIFENKDDLIKNINKKDISSHSTKQYLPITNKNGQLVGCLYLQYEIGSVEISKNVFNSFVVLGTTYISPFLFIILYTIAFGKRFSKNINNTLEKLISSSEKIQNNDLDFNLSYPYDNELGELTNSFEKMRLNLKETLNKQWKSEKEKREIIQALSHDLRTPLTLVKGNVELLQSGAYKNEEKLKRYLNTIEKSTNRAVLLVEDLNTLAKIDDVDFSLNKEDVFVKDFISEKVEEYKVLLDERNIKLNLKIENMEDNLSIYIDKSQVSRVLDNIITNTLRYVNRSIEIKVWKDKGNLIVKIKDDGLGFNEKDLDKVFDRFYKGDKSRTKSGGNSGLGLYISKKIIEKHGGYIRAYNENGAVIEFMLKIEGKDE